MNPFHFLQQNQRRSEVMRFNIAPGSEGAFPITVRVSGVARWAGDVLIDRARQGPIMTEKVTRAIGAPSNYTRTWTTVAEAPPFDALVIEYVNEGDVFFSQGGCSNHLVTAGQAYFLRKGVSQSYRTGPAGYVHKRYVEIAGPQLTSLLRTLGLSDKDVLPIADCISVNQLFKRIHRLMERSDPEWADKLSLAAYELLLALKRGASSELPKALKSALQYIDRHLQRPILHEELQDVAGLASTHLWRLFKEHVGVSPMKYIANQRMIYAQQLLRRPELSIKQIASSVGFDDQLYFSAQFKKHCGVSPKTFRSQKG